VAGVPDTLPATDEGRTAGAHRAAPWVLYLLTLASAYPLGAVITHSLPQPEGSCSGIGFGCSLYGWDAAQFFLLMFGLPYAAVLAIVLGLLGFLPDRWRPAQTVVAAVGLAVPWALVVAIAAGS
jgi:hypothetical protein